MKIQEISEWASAEIKTIEVTQGFGNTSYPLEVREFTPVDGDMLEERWNDEGVIKYHRIPPYGIADMQAAARNLAQFIDNSIGQYIIGAVGYSDSLLWHTYMMAFKHSREATVSPKNV